MTMNKQQTSVFSIMALKAALKNLEILGREYNLSTAYHLQRAEDSITNALTWLEANQEQTEPHPVLSVLKQYDQEELLEMFPPKEES